MEGELELREREIERGIEDNGTKEGVNGKEAEMGMKGNCTKESNTST